MNISSEPTVFVVDDDDGVRESIELLLDTEGLEAESYATAEAFLSAYQADRPGCLLLDISMPGMNGLELQQTLLAKQLRIPIIFISGHGDVPMTVTALKAGAIDFIEKPFDADALLQRIRKAIALDSNTRELEAKKLAHAVEQYAESIVETVREPLLVLNDKLEVLSANQSIFTTFQIPENRHGTGDLENFVKELWQITGLRKRIEGAIANNQELQDIEIAYEFKNTGQKFLRVNLHELQQTSNQPKRYLLAMENITQRKYADERSRILLESAPDAIVVVNQQGKIRLVNEQAEILFGYPRTNLINQAVEILFPKNSLTQYNKPFTSHINDTRSRPMHNGLNLYGLNNDNEEIPVEISLSHFHSDEGVLVSAVIRDIRERKHIEQELEHYRNHLEELVTKRTIDLEASNKELETFSYSIAHDLRTPLRAITSFSQILQENIKEQLDSENLEFLSRIIAAGKNMSQLIDDILELSRITRSSIRFASVNLSKIANEIVSQLKLSDPYKEVQWHVKNNIMVSGDLQLLKIALQNLIENAWKYTRDTSPALIELGVEKNESEIAYYIKDNGIGFDMGYQTKLFRPFHRLHSLHEYEGTGIGLATFQRIIQRHGGRVWAKAQKDQGATFYFTLTNTHLKNYPETSKLNKHGELA